MTSQRRSSQIWLRWLARAGVVLLLASAGILGFAHSGIYDIAATRQHTVAVYWTLITTMHHSIRRHAALEVPEPPDLAAKDRVEEGLLLHRRHCIDCHGAPGVGPAAFAFGMTPPPSNLVRSGRDRSPRELFWTTAHGLKMTGMPAWTFRMRDDEIWAVVAFLKSLPTLSPADYRARVDFVEARTEVDRGREKVTP